MNLERKCKLLERKNSSLQERNKNLRSENDSLKRKNSLLLDKIILFESDYKSYKEAKERLDKDLEELSKIKLEYSHALCKMKQMQSEYKKEFLLLNKDLKKCKNKL